MGCCSVPPPARESKDAAGGDERGAYAQTRLRHNTAEHRELRLRETEEEEEDPQYTDDNAILLDNNKL